MYPNNRCHRKDSIKSYYFDDFKTSYPDKMFAVVPGMFVYHVFEEKEGKLLTTVRFDAESVASADEKCRRYMNRSKQRFHYSLFERPDGFLQSIVPQRDRPCYIFERLPHFGVEGEAEFQEGFQLDDDEMELVRREFAPLIWDVAQFDGDMAVRHIFCTDDIEDALLKSRHVSQELTAIMGRRVNMTSQRLAERLALLKTLLNEHKNYEVCFLPDEVFKKLTMQVMVYADRAAIGWVAGGKSTACRDYTNVNALFGFCDSMWEKIPNALKLRRVAVGKLSVWLKKAKKYGYDV